MDLEEQRQLQVCLNWLSKKQFTDSKNKKIVSTDLKHLIEQELKTYVSREAVLAAIEQLGIPYRRHETSPNLVYVSIKLRDLDPKYGRDKTIRKIRTWKELEMYKEEKRQRKAITTD